MYVSMAIRHYESNTLEDVINVINSGGSCEGVQGVEFSAEQLAGQYAWEAAKEHADAEEIQATEADREAHLEILAEAGAKFDFSAALEHANKLAAIGVENHG